LPGSTEYRILRDWIAAGLPQDPPETPVLQRLEVTPTEQVLAAPLDRLQLQVRATFSDGSTHDVTRLAVYEPSNQAGPVTPAGEVRRQQLGDTTILVRYLDRQAAVALAFVLARPGYVWRDVPEANYIDHHVFARLGVLRLQPSALCSDSVFL